MVLNNPLFVARNSRSSGFQIEQSLRFNDDDTAHFDRTPSSVGARQTWTYSVWVKGSDFSGDANTLLSGGNYAYGTYLWFRDGGHISLGRYYSGSYTFLVEAAGFYRDPSAWYHIVCVFDSGQATASDRVKLYVNNERITSFITASYPSQHFETDINNDGIQWIGERGYDSALKLHGYLAEAHLVDGSPLEPTNFGEYDENGVWRPIEVNLTGPNDGTTWSDYLTDSSGSFQASYPATKAFNGTTDAANVARASTSNTTTTFEPPTDIPYTSSVEVWTYYAGSVSLNGGSAVSVSNDQFWRTIATGSGSLDTLTFTSSSSSVYLGAIRIDGVILIDGNTHQYGKNGFYLDFNPSGDNATINNGTTWSTYLTDSSGSFNGSYPATNAFNGVISDSSTARASTTNTTTTFQPPTDITYTSSVEVWTYYGGSVSLNGGSSVSVNNDQAWKTIATGSGSLDTLTFTSSSSYVWIGGIRIDGVILIDGGGSAIGRDLSGNSNHWTPNNFTTSGTGTDVMSDTPTNNFATLNPLEAASASAGTLSDGNLYILSQDYSLQKATFHFGGGGPTSGKYYWEVTHTGGNYTSYIGVTANLTQDAGEIAGGGDKSWFGNNTSRKYDNTTQSYTGSYSSGDVHGYAIDLDAQEIKYYINGTLKITDSTLPDPATTELVPFQFTTNSGSGYSWSNTIWNFGQRAFSHQPTGYKSLCTANLPAPDIAKGSDYFNSVIYAPDGSSSFAVTGVGFQPDLVWVKSRVYSEDHQLNDAVRGATKGLQSNLTNAETTQTNGLTSFDSDGFTVGNLSDYNYNGDSIISWNWKANGSGSSNTDGSITSTVSANPTAGFSIVSYTGDGSSSSTVGHGLGVKPAMILMKARAGTNASNHWYGWHKSLSSGYNIRLSSADAQLNTSSASSGVIAAPTNTTTFGFTAGSNVLNVNENNTTYIAYCFAEVEGYSKFGIIVGNYTDNGPFIYLGFTPAVLILKNAERSGTDWVIMDATRDTYNAADSDLRPSNSDSERTGTDRVDFCSNGFKLRTSHLSWNGPDDAPGIIYAAFASHPFGGSGVSPATAR